MVLNQALGSPTCIGGDVVPVLRRFPNELVLFETLGRDKPVCLPMGLPLGSWIKDSLGFDPWDIMGFG